MELLLTIAPIYLLPTLVAWRQGHPHRTAITVLNIVAGWTFIGWVGAFVWCFIPVRQPGANDFTIRL